MLLTIWMLFILVISIVPVSGPQTELPSDKLAHFIIYGLTAVLMFRYLADKVSKVRAACAAVIGASVYGAFMETIQYFMPPRSFSLGDMASNTAGALFFAVVYVTWRGR